MSKSGVYTNERAVSPPREAALTETSGYSYSKLKQHIGALLTAAFSLLLLILTIAYALRWIGVSRYRAIGTSRTYTILILRILSEMTTTLLGLTLAFTIERIQWHQIVREKGQPFLSFLGLAQGTGIFGLAKLSIKKGPFTASWRWWSASRLLIIATLPILNVVIFGNIHTRLSYRIETTKSGAFNMGMGNFNVSTAQNFASLAGLIFGIDFPDFLSDSRIAVDITPSREDTVPCTLGVSKSSRQTCNQVFYVPGTYGDLDLLKNQTLPHADLIVVHDIRGYQLDFHTPEENIDIEFNLENDCGVYGNNVVAFQICFQDKEDEIAMRMNTCYNLTDTAACLSDTEWRRLPGVSSNLKVNARLGTVGFSRLNSTIQTYELADDVKPAHVTAGQLSDAFYGFFTGRSREEDNDIPSEWTDLMASVDPYCTAAITKALATSMLFTRW